MTKKILCAFGTDIDSVAGWIGSYGGGDSPSDIQRGIFATRQLAKRQLTWFRHFPGVDMVSPQEAETKANIYISSITPAIGSAGSPL